MRPDQEVSGSDSGLAVVGEDVVPALDGKQGGDKEPRISRRKAAHVAAAQARRPEAGEFRLVGDEMQYLTAPVGPDFEEVFGALTGVPAAARNEQDAPPRRRERVEFSFEPA